MQTVRSTPRHFRSFLRRMIGTKNNNGNFKLYLLSPTQADSSFWHYAITYGGHFHIVSRPLPNRDFGRNNAVARFGVKAAEIRLKRQKAKQAA